MRRRITSQLYHAGARGIGRALSCAAVFLGRVEVQFAQGYLLVCHGQAHVLHFVSVCMCACLCLCFCVCLHGAYGDVHLFVCYRVRHRARVRACALVCARISVHGRQDIIFVLALSTDPSTESAKCVCAHV